MINLIVQTWLRMIDTNGLIKDYKALNAVFSGLQDLRINRVLVTYD